MTNLPAAATRTTTRLALDATWPLDELSEAYEITRETLRRAEQQQTLHGLRGTRAQLVGGSQLARDGVTGEIVLMPGPIALARLLPRILGALSAPGVFVPGEGLSEFHALVDRRIAVFGYRQLRVAQAAFTCRGNGPLELRLAVVGESVTPLAAGEFPALAEQAERDQPQFDSSTARLTLAGTEQEFHSWRMTIENVPRVVAGLGRQGAGDLIAVDRRVTLEVVVPGDTTSPATGMWEARHAAVSGNFLIDAGGIRLEFAWPHLVREPEGNIQSLSTRDRRCYMRISALRPSDDFEVTLTLGANV